MTHIVIGRYNKYFIFKEFNRDAETTQKRGGRVKVKKNEGVENQLIEKY